MKKLILFIGAFLVVLAPLSAENKSKESKAFEYTYASNLFDYKAKQLSKRDVRLLGEPTANMIALLDEACIKYQESDYKPNLIKPELYDSITKVIRYYKKQIKSGEISKEEGTELLNELLRKAYVCVYEDTHELEGMLNKANTIEEILHVMSLVHISKL